MPDIKLVMHNRTNLNLVFDYNAVNYEIAAKRSQIVTVEAGHIISVRDPNHTKVTRGKRTVEPDFYNSNLMENTVIDCNLIGWQLELKLGRDIF